MSSPMAEPSGELGEHNQSMEVEAPGIRLSTRTSIMGPQGVFQNSARTTLPFFLSFWFASTPSEARYHTDVADIRGPPAAAQLHELHLTSRHYAPRGQGGRALDTALGHV